ncbi:hypothetical protein Ccar_21625 [Clostridium carboxidivorans P7]|uniref:Calycin-like domain-containing protein n=1 Tax=Clostridium carboxidivorans P7 TaxID=536227 RepID=C6PVF5_9CLOT|nr:DUF1934 domain-containing protein [Clostridium carboxidivorans]AKN33288.1 hypothetical protein Ccar_21625 [Clostridium carboxidivorans P7]EET86797.1 protein of unknown function DUF1934 [Clostridium carboxidivorans P7]
MKKKAIISVLSKQTEDTDDVIEVVTPGNFYKKDDTYYAIYKETKISGMEGTTTTLKISEDKFSLIRSGSTTSKMEFYKGKEDISMYDTPYGTLELKTQTNKLIVNLDDDGGEILIDYIMSISGHKPQNTLLEINIKTQQ